MRIIYKYPLDILTDNVSTLPKDGKIIHVGRDPNGLICIWLEINPDNELERRSFVLFGTGRPFDDDTLQHVGSVLDGHFVWHIYEKPVS